MEKSDDEDTISTDSHQELDQSILEEIEKTIERVISQSLNDEKNNDVSKLDSAILRKVQAYLHSSRASTKQPIHSTPPDKMVLKAIEESVEHNLKEILLQYSTKMTKLDVEELLRSTNLDEVSQEQAATNISRNAASLTEKSKNEPSLEPNEVGKNDNIFETKSFRSLFPKNVEVSPPHTSAPDDDESDFIPVKKKGKRIVQNMPSGILSRNESSPSTEDDAANSLLIVPKVRGTRVFTDLLDVGIQPRNYDVNRKAEFPSGAVLFIFNSVQGKEGLKKVVEESGRYLIETRKKSFQHSVRVQKLNPTLTEADVWEAMAEKFNEPPTGVSFLRLPYEKSSKTMDAVLHVSDSLFAKIKKSPDIQIRGRKYQIDTSENVTRCFKCHLLGHRSKLCEYEPRLPPTPAENCIDCSNYNKQIQEMNISGIKGRRPRDVDHPTGDDKCMTKMYFESLWQKQRKRG